MDCSLVRVVLLSLFIAGCAFGHAAPAGGISPTFPPGSLNVAPGFESPPIVEARQYLESKEMRGPGFSVRERARNDGWFNHFEIDSPYGVFYAGSVDMARIRIYEVAATHAMYRFTQGDVLFESAVEEGKNILLAPARTVNTVFNALIHPEETWRKIQGVPEGVGRIESDISEGVTKTLSSEEEAERDSSAVLEAEPSSKDVERVVKFALRQYGFNPTKNEREWYRKNNLDPYTDNPVLRDRVARLATIQSATKVTSRLVPGVFGGLGLLSDLNRYLRWVERISLYDDPWKLAERNVASLRSIGIREEAIAAFYSNANLTPTYQSIIIEALRNLDGVGGRSGFVDLCATAKRREDALFFSQVAVSIAALHRSGERVGEIVVGSSLPAIETVSRRLIVVLPVDLLVWSLKLAAAIEQMTALRETKGLSHSELRVKGDLSERTKSELRNRGVAFVERYRRFD